MEDEQQIEFVSPGQRLGHYVEEYASGPGTYVRDQQIYSSLVGIKQIIENEGENQNVNQK